jgi:hypothetical protein
MKMTSELKSRVMSLGNRLAPKMDGGKSAAFIRAWAIVKQGSFEIAVKGTSFGSRQEALKRLAKYSPDQIKAVFVPEPNNPADPAALAVMVGVQGGRGLFRLGYVPKNMTAVVAAIGGQLPALRVVSGTWAMLRVLLTVQGLRWRRCNVYGIIYKATGPSGLVYIGQTTESLNERKRRHQVRAYKGDRREPFIVALAGSFSNFTWEQIEQADTAAELDAKEQHYITVYKADNPANGYNSRGGGVTGYIHSPETRRKISLAQKGQKRKPLSLEHRQKLSIAHKGKKRSPESCQKTSETNRGKKRTPEQIQRMSEARKGKPNGNKGRKLSPETRQRISATLKSKGILPPSRKGLPPWNKGKRKV